MGKDIVFHIPFQGKYFGRVKIQEMREIELSADALIGALLGSAEGTTHILDSCGVGRRGANRTIGGVRPVRTVEISGGSPRSGLAELEDLTADGRSAVIFTISYDFGAKLAGVQAGSQPSEPDIYAALFDELFLHDHETGRSMIIGGPSGAIPSEIAACDLPPIHRSAAGNPAEFESNFTEAAYLEAVEEIRSLIRDGETYQTNLTQQLTAQLPDGLTPATIFLRLRSRHPAPFAAFIERPGSTVVSASPELFFRVESDAGGRRIVVEPIKGTRRRGHGPADDARLRDELATSAKDRAENIMIVDLMRNDLGRVCEYGSVRVEELCRIDAHPTLFHLVSCVSGNLRPEAGIAEVLAALFPCGSVTGAPKIRTMEVITGIEPAPRGLSMGTIGCWIPESFGIGEILEASVAIRTMVIQNGTARFNVGGGIVIDSDPKAEFDESMLKAKALLSALGSNVVAPTHIPASIPVRS